MGNGPCSPSADVHKEPFQAKGVSQYQDLELVQLALAKWEQICVFSAVLSHLACAATAMVAFSL